MSKKGANILECQARDCSYNLDGRCHTIAINVGGPEPLCDTYVNIGSKVGLFNTMPKVGACKVRNCAHNKSLECIAKGIHVILRDNQALCGLYQMRG